MPIHAYSQVWDVHDVIWAEVIIVQTVGVFYGSSGFWLQELNFLTDIFALRRWWKLNCFDQASKFSKFWNIKFKLWTWWKIIFVSKLCLSFWGLRQKSQGLIMLMEILIDYHYYTSKEELELFVLFCFLLGSGQFSHSSSLIYPMWEKGPLYLPFPCL